MLDLQTYLLHKHITTSQRLIEGHVKSQYPTKFPIFIVWAYWYYPHTYVFKEMGEFGGQIAHSTLNTDCEPEV